MTSKVSASTKAFSTGSHLLFNLPTREKANVVIAMKAPTDGRYTLCSNMTSFIGIMLDSTDNVMKNQNIPKDTSRILVPPALERLKIYTPRQKINRRPR